MRTTSSTGISSQRTYWCLKISLARSAVGSSSCWQCRALADDGCGGDFGVTTMFEDGMRGRVGADCWMAPESKGLVLPLPMVAKQEGTVIQGVNYDFKVDVYSFGYSTTSLPVTETGSNGEE